jgi:hypothetical protein
LIDRDLIQSLRTSPKEADRARAEYLVFLSKAAATREWDDRHRPGPLDPTYFDVHTRAAVAEDEEFEGWDDIAEDVA